MLQKDKNTTLENRTNVIHRDLQKSYKKHDVAGF